MKILTIIPAKLDSTRLQEKNIQDINGKPMFHHSIEYAQNTKHQNKIIVSSESDKVNDLLPNDVLFHKRDLNLCGDVEVVDVYLNVIEKINEDFDYVVCLQPDNPDRTNTFDECLDYVVDNNYDDLITVNDDYKRSGSVRIFKYEHLKNKFVSKRMGVLKDSATDIHYKSDLNKVRGKYE